MDLDQKVKRSEIWKNYVEIVAIFIAAAWAIYVFVQEKFIIPSHQPPFLNVSTSQEIAGKKDAFFILRSTITVTNPGKIRTKVLASTFDLAGSKISFVNMTDSGYVEFVNKHAQDTSNSYSDIYSRYYYPIETSIIKAGKIFNEEWWFDPQEVFTVSFLSIVPDTFEIAELTTDILTSYDTDMKDIDINYSAIEKGPFIYHTYKHGKNVELTSFKEFAKNGLSYTRTSDEIALK